MKKRTLNPLLILLFLCYTYMYLYLIVIMCKLLFQRSILFTLSKIMGWVHVGATLQALAAASLNRLYSIHYSIQQELRYELRSARAFKYWIRPSCQYHSFQTVLQTCTTGRKMAICKWYAWKDFNFWKRARILINQSLADLCTQILGLKYKLFNYKAIKECICQFIIL